MDAVFACLGLLYAFCVSDYLPWLLGLDLDGHEKMVREAIEMMTRLPDVLIDERWRQWKSGGKQGLEDFLDVLITLEDAEAKPVLTIEEVKALSQDITLVAMDNPSNAVEWALAEMVNSPETLKKAGEEIDGVVGRDRLVQESDIPRLNYLKACIRARGVPPPPRRAVQRTPRRARRRHCRRLPHPQGKPRHPQPHWPRPQPCRLGRPTPLQSRPPHPGGSGECHAH